MLRFADQKYFGLVTKWTRFVPLLITRWWVFSIYLGRSAVFLSQMISDDGQILVLIIIKLLTSSSDLSAICQNLSQFIIHPTNPSVIWEPTLTLSWEGIKKFFCRLKMNNWMWELIYYQALCQLWTFLYPEESWIFSFSFTSHLHKPWTPHTFLYKMI